MNKTLTNKAGNLILELRQDSMSAWMTIKKSRQLLDEQDILSLIESAGIKTGFEEAIEHIRAHSLEKEFDNPFPIAICKGGNSESVLRYHFNPDVCPDPLQTMSYHDFSHLTVVAAGAPIAEYTNNLFEQGGSIYDIFGELINPGVIDEAKASSLTGINVRFDLADRCYYATQAGYPYVDEDGRICLCDKVQLNSNDLPPQISFDAPVEVFINGNINNLTISSTHDLRISGNITNSEINCMADLVIEGDIIDCNASLLDIKGNLSLENAISSKILVQGQLHFTGSVHNCTIACDGDILGAENSIISGGNAQAGGSISIARVGDSSGALTELEVSISPYYRTLLMHQTRELIRLKSAADTSPDAISSLQEQIRLCEAKLDSNLSAFLNRSREDRKRIYITSGANPPLSVRVLKQFYQYSDPLPTLEVVEKDQ